MWRLWDMGSSQACRIYAAWSGGAATPWSRQVCLHLCLMSSAPAVVDAVVESLSGLQGAYSLLLLVNDELIAARDPHGFRPLCMGRLGDAIVVCSETCALDAIGAQYCREIE